MQEKLRYLPNLRYIENENKVIMVNRNNGQWLRISKECFGILNSAVEKQLSIQELLDCLADDEDRKYFRELLDNVKALGVLYDNDTNELGIKTVYLILTNRCNLKCIHCCVSAKSNYDEISKQEMNTQELFEAIDKIVACHPTNIILTGGEPMLRKDFMVILKYLRNVYDGEISLATNAMYINEHNVHSLIKNIDRIDISIDGVDEESCSVVRGKGVFNKVIKAVRLIKNAGFDAISLSMVFGDYNEGLEDKFKKMNNDLGTIPVSRIFVPTGRGKENSQIFIDVKKRLPSISYTKEEIESKRNSITAIKCGAGFTEFVLNYDGYVYPCANLINSSYRRTNIKKINSLDELLQQKYQKSSSRNALEQIQPENFKECKTCKVNLFCWQCLQEIEVLKNNPEKFNFRCKHKKGLLYSILWE